MAQNVFLEKKYYITESSADNLRYPTDTNTLTLLTSGTTSSGTTGYGQDSNPNLPRQWNSSCTQIGTINPSSISITGQGTTGILQDGQTNPLNILEVYAYITFLVNNFSTDYTLATSCDTGSRYSPNTGNGFQGGCCKGADMQDSCMTFANFTDSNYKPSFPLSGDKYSLYKRLNINEFIYKDTGKRSLCQQFSDINSLVTSLKPIVTTAVSSIDNKTDPKQFQEIQASYSQMIQLRNKLDVQLQQLMNKGSMSAENKLQLDSTVYTTVLWTVLATSVLYYVFIKL
jgi:hypothetical protein